MGTIPQSGKPDSSLYTREPFGIAFILMFVLKLMTLPLNVINSIEQQSSKGLPLEGKVAAKQTDEVSPLQGAVL